MLTPPLTAADVGGLFKTTCGKRAFVMYGPDGAGEFSIAVEGNGSGFFDSTGQTEGGSYTLARRLPISDPITELERRVVEAAVAWQQSTGTIKHVPFRLDLNAATDALIASRKPRPRRVDSPEALRKALLAAGWGDALSAEAAKHLFNELPEVEE